MNRSIFSRTRLLRFGKFGAVGIMGVGVNLLFYALFMELLGLADFLSRALAIELSILHNFAWNFAWTWKDRGTGIAMIPLRLVKYHGSSLFSSFVITLAVGWIVLRIVPEIPLERYISHLAGIGAGMITNYLLADFWVFTHGGAPDDREAD